MTPELICEGPSWDAYRVECPKCGERPPFLWGHNHGDELKSTDVKCYCGNIIPVMLPYPFTYSPYAEPLNK